MAEYRLGRSIVQLVPFYKKIQKRELLTTKMLIVFGVVAMAKIAVLLLWT